MYQRVFVLNLILLLPAWLFCQQRYAVVINEIMADPTPSVGLPNVEWIELKNISTEPVDLAGWRIADAGNRSSAFGSYVLAPDSFVLICSGSAANALSVYGPVLPVSGFPTLDNAGDELSLQSPSGNTIHAVKYDLSWYGNPILADGGWSLEQIDPHHPCAGRSNWTASSEPGGGTPGRTNARAGAISDTEGPAFLTAYLLNDSTIVLRTNEPVDSASAADLQHYQLSNGISIYAAAAAPPLFAEILLHTDQLLPGIIYTITTTGITDCSGNQADNRNAVRVGLPSLPEPSDLIINEILFHPKTGGSDYVELLNRSDKIIDAGRLFLANRNSSGMINAQKALYPGAWYLFPGDYAVWTEDRDDLSHTYFVRNPDVVLELSSLPSYPDREGTVVLTDQRGEVLDEVHYHEDWHFKLIDNPEGIALERIDPGGTSQDAGNWHSAASTAGYGTPGYRNSQFMRVPAIDGSLKIVPATFSPDNDGFDDVAALVYELSEPGYVANVTIFNAAGIPVRYLVKNGTMGGAGSWNWDGLDDHGNRLPVGTYVVFAEIFNLRGRKQQYRLPVVLAGKL